MAGLNSRIRTFNEVKLAHKNSNTDLKETKKNNLEILSSTFRNMLPSVKKNAQDAWKPANDEQPKNNQSDCEKTYFHDYDKAFHLAFLYIQHEMNLGFLPRIFGKNENYYINELDTTYGKNLFQGIVSGSLKVEHPAAAEKPIKNLIEEICTHKNSFFNIEPFSIFFCLFFNRFYNFTGLTKSAQKALQSFKKVINNEYLNSVAPSTSVQNPASDSFSTTNFRASSEVDGVWETTIPDQGLGLPLIVCTKREVIQEYKPSAFASELSAYMTPHHIANAVQVAQTNYKPSQYSLKRAAVLAQLDAEDAAQERTWNNLPTAQSDKLSTDERQNKFSIPTAVPIPTAAPVNNEFLDSLLRKAPNRDGSRFTKYSPKTANRRYSLQTDTSEKNSPMPVSKPFATPKIIQSAAVQQTNTMRSVTFSPRINNQNDILSSTRINDNNKPLESKSKVKKKKQSSLKKTRNIEIDEPKQQQKIKDNWLQKRREEREEILSTARANWIVEPSN